jgi:hypothetical protein
MPLHHLFSSNFTCDAPPHLIPVSSLDFVSRPVMPRELALTIENDYESLSFVKNCYSYDVIGWCWVPKNLLQAVNTGRGDISLCYGRAHPLYRKESDNLARFKLWGQVTAEGTVLCKIPGIDSEFPPPVRWPLLSGMLHSYITYVARKVAPWDIASTLDTIAISPISSSDPHLIASMEDQLRGTEVLQNVLESFIVTNQMARRPVSVVFCARLSAQASPDLDPRP